MIQGLKFQNCLTRAKNLAIAKYGMTFAHIGIAFVILGVTGNSVWKIEKISIAKFPDPIYFQNFQVPLKSLHVFEIRKSDEFQKCSNKKISKTLK